MLQVVAIRWQGQCRLPPVGVWRLLWLVGGACAFRVPFGRREREAHLLLGRDVGSDSEKNAIHHTARR